MRLDYKDLKSTIYKSANKAGGKHDTDFTVDYDELKKNAAELNLIPVPVGLKARRISMEDMLMFAEYYRSDKLVWLNRTRFVTSLVFVDKDAMDSDLEEALDILGDDPGANPDSDHISIYADIVANYPCYFALVASYRNNSPEYFGMNSYFIACRANKVVVKDPNYIYNPRDIDTNKETDSTAEDTSVETESE